ncbi:MAG: DNA polymerase, partial [Myxococcales bacterium]
ELEFHRLLEHLAPHRDKGEQFLPEPSPALPPTTTVLDEVLLGKIAEGARTSGVLAFHTVGTSPEPMRAALVGLGLAVGPGECFYLPVAHRSLDAPKQLPWERIQALLGPVFGDAAVKKCCHDLKYSEVLLARHGIALAGPVFDPMLASYLLDPESPSTLPELTRRDLGITLTPAEALTSKSRQVQLELDDASVDRVALFAASRAAVTLVLAERYEPRLDREGLGKLLCDVELPLLRVLSAMEQRGVLVDVQKLQALGVQVDAELRAIEAKAKALVGVDFAIRSRDRLETLLFDTMKLRVVKKTPKGGRSTDAEVLEELASEHPIARLVLEHRELDKLKGTYIEALPRAVNGTTGRIHTSFGQATAATGRLSSNDPNLQNIPIRTGLGRSLREAFVAPAGHVILSADYSQVELRVLAHLSLDPALVDAFSTGADVHRRTAALVFDCAEDKVTPEMRRQAKVINFGVIYGMGDSALAKQLGISRADAAKFIASYFERYKGVAQFFERTVEAARQGEAVRTLLGRRRFLPNLTSGNRGLRAEAERIAKNTAVQGTAADILKLAMVRLGVGEVVPGARMILTVHDELVFEVPVEGIDAASGAIREAMETSCKLAVPLVVDIRTGANWAQAH